MLPTPETMKSFRLDLCRDGHGVVLCMSQTMADKAVARSRQVRIELIVEALLIYLPARGTSRYL
jgi:hypothetical protein